MIQGSGPLGLLATAVANVAGARKVITIGAPDARLSIATEFGADQTLSIERTSEEERAERIKTATDGRGADIVMEFTGHPSALNEGLAFVSAHQRQFPFDRMISTRYSLDEVNLALQRMKKYEEIKPMIEPWKRTPRITDAAAS